VNRTGAEKHTGARLHPAASLAVALALFAGAATWASSASTHVGFAWAENDYLDHMDRIVEWSARLREMGLRQGIAVLTGPYWEAKRFWNPHPPLFKYAGLLGREVWPGLGFPRAERLASALLLGALTAFAFLALHRTRGFAAALFGAVALAALPRLFAHAMFCTTEIPLAAGWLVASLAHERFEDTRKKRWLAAAAASFAWALGSKLSALLLLVPLGVLTLVWRYRRGFVAVARGAAALAGVLAAGVVSLVVLYPFLWPDPLGRLALLIREARDWSKVNPFTALFFGRVMPYPELPWYFAPVILFLVVPPLVLALASWGAAFVRRRDRLWLAAVVQVGFWLLLMALPNTPKYDDERQMVPIFPFLGLLAGIGFADVFERIRGSMRERSAAPVEIGAACAAALAMVLSLAAALPFPLSYYSPLVGGIRGAYGLGFQPTYAMETLSPDLLKSFSEQIPRRSTITVLPATDFGPFLQRRGYLRPDLRVGPRDTGPFYFVVNRHDSAGGPVSRVESEGKLLGAYDEDGVVLVGLFHLPGGLQDERKP